ncbi:alternative oxidase, mitochondrial-like [Actinia tenebrosa]|uniref:Alternative oxidase, mitochondrial-like n=1 Tax=Actinia tenebrosa TaxID=6105 RepID=A0A6P8IMC6_ACTTE|nr:alternative oxidase, mitochondrial-like [Actinia tenebrosa]
MIVPKLGRFHSSGSFAGSRSVLAIILARGPRLGAVNIRSCCQMQGGYFPKISTPSAPYSVRTMYTSSYCCQNLPHFKESQNDAACKDSKKEDSPYLLPHPIWTEEDVNKVKITHKEPQDKIDKVAYYSVQLLRTAFDLASFYKIGPMTENKWLNRIIMLETVAGVPGMIGGMARHLKSLRRLSRDHGWIHTLLEEAENERMHLMTALEMKKPGALFRGVIIAAQGVFVNMFFIAYMISPRFCHRFVGYLEEEAVKTYTYCLKCIDEGKLPKWEQMKAPQIAVNYWKLGEDAMMRDVILAIRADEAHHRVVNHTLGTINPHEPNPFLPGQRKL